jgi:glycerol uptake facilitator-like aquaporin
VNKLAAEFLGTFALVVAGTVCRLICPEKRCGPLSAAPDARDQNGSEGM